MQEFVNKNGKHIVYGIALVVSVTIISLTRYSYAAGNNSNQVFTRDELSEKIVQLENNTSSSNMFLNNYPIGSIFMTTTSTNPGVTYGGTWVAWGNGQVPVGVDSTQTEFNTVEKTGGEKTHLLSVLEMPSHTHTQSSHSHNIVTIDVYNPSIIYKMNDDSGDAITSTDNAELSYGHLRNDNIYFTQLTTATNQYTGGSTAHNNLQPYITCYMWKRTS